MARSDPAINLRIPAELKDRVAKAAQESGRSTNAEIVHRLERSLSEDPQASVKRGLAFSELRQAAEGVVRYWEIDDRNEFEEDWLDDHIRELKLWLGALERME